MNQNNLYYLDPSATCHTTGGAINPTIASVVCVPLLELGQCILDVDTILMAAHESHHCSKGAKTLLPVNWRPGRHLVDVFLGPFTTQMPLDIG